MRATIASLLFICLNLTVVAQSNYKEGSNSFARYTKSGQIKDLENAKKFIDNAYKTKRDTTSDKNNILRALIYSSLAYADSTRKIKTDKDPIDIANHALSKIREKRRSNYENEIQYVNQNLSAAYIYKANKAVENKDYANAYTYFLEVSKLGTTSNDVVNNLALLAAQAGKTDEAIAHYKHLIKETNADPSKYLALASLYKEKKEAQLYLNTLQEGRNKFMDNKDILFLLLQAYADNKSYPAVVTIIDEALKYEPNNIDLLYLGGFANENSNNTELAKKYYNRIIELDENNYDANLALGLINLNVFLKDNNNLEGQYNAQNYLLKANEIKPYAVNTLQGLALFYEATQDADQLDRVKVLLNQLSNN